MRELTEKEQLAVDRIINTFDFSRAQGLFALMGWTYYEGETPTVNMLKESARSLLTSVIVHKSDWTESGRFLASHECDELELRLVFDNNITYLANNLENNE